MRMSVSDLECYRRYRDNEDVTIEECLAQLRRESPPSPVMMAGRALHSILERVEPGFEDMYAERDGFRFYFHCDIPLAAPAIRELKGEVQIDTAYGPVDFVGIVDSMNGAIRDYKFTTGQFDAERYARSYQWRAYLTMFGGHKFVYHVFQGKEERDLWAIYDYHELAFYRYPGIEEDVRKQIEECAGFFRRYGLGCGGIRG